MIPRVKAYSERINDPHANSKDENGTDVEVLIWEGDKAGLKNLTPNLVTSHVKDVPGMHAVAIDIDMGAQLYPSRTEGHYHLYIDKMMKWDDYVELLQALAKAGIIEEGYAAASIAKGCTALRLPKHDQAFENLKEQIKADGLFADNSITEIVDATLDPFEGDLLF